MLNLSDFIGQTVMVEYRWNSLEFMFMGELETITNHPDLYFITIIGSKRHEMSRIIFEPSMVKLFTDDKNRLTVKLDLSIWKLGTYNPA